MKGLIAHYLELLLKTNGLLSESVREELRDIATIEQRLDEFERQLKRIQPAPSASAVPGKDDIPFWQGSHLVPGAMDPLKVRLETHPNEGSAANVSPCWAIVWSRCDDEESIVMLAYRELEPLAKLLMQVAASYRDSQNAVSADLAVGLALGDLMEEARRELMEDLEDEHE